MREKWQRFCKQRESGDGLTDLDSSFGANCIKLCVNARGRACICAIFKRSEGKGFGALLIDMPKHVQNYAI